MARMQLEVERQTKKKSPIADIVGFMSYNHLLSTITGHSENCVYMCGFCMQRCEDPNTNLNTPEMSRL